MEQPVRTAAVLACCLLIASLTGPDAARSQEPTAGADIDSPYRWVDGSVRVAPFVGLMDTGRGNLKLGPRNAPIVGARGRARLTAPISLEATLGFVDAERAVVDPRLPGGPAPVDSLVQRLVVAEGGLQISFTGRRTWHRLQPYAVFGGGMVIGVDEPSSPLLPDAEADTADFRFEMGVTPAALAGLGTELIVSDRIGIGLEVRDHLWKMTTPDGFFQEEILRRIRENDRPAPQETEWTHNVEFSVGLWYYF